jgi:hypothetical protein
MTKSQLWFSRSLLTSLKIRALPVVRFPQNRADRLGDKCCAKIILLDKTPGIMPLSTEEWDGINALVQDGELHG